MYWLFLGCAVVGGTVLACQTLLTFIGLGGDEIGDFDVGDADAGGGFDAGDFDVDGDVGDFDAAAGDADFDGDGLHEGASHGGSWLFGILSFRTLVAAFTFFGLGGLTADAADQTPLVQIVVALVGGGIAMYLVHWVMKLFKTLGNDGTVQIQRALGQTAKVYLSIPADRQGAGKIHVTVQERLMDYPAVTAHNEILRTGATVKVVRVIGGNTLEVAPIKKKEPVA